MKRSNIFAITENGKTRYGKTKIYGGLSGIAMRLCLNSLDGHGEARPLFDRLDRVAEIGAADWRRISEEPHLADDYYSFIQINADKNMVYADEDWRKRGERRYIEVPLDKLLETSAPLIENSRYSGYPTLDKHRLNRFLKQHFVSIRREAYRQDSGEKASVPEQLHTEPQPRESHAPRERRAPEADDMTKNCKLCGRAMVWENPHIPGHFHASSCDIEDWPICHDCMIEHCCHTNCIGCEYGKYPDCRFLDLKRHYMNNE